MKIIVTTVDQVTDEHEGNIGAISDPTTGGLIIINKDVQKDNAQVLREAVIAEYAQSYWGAYMISDVDIKCSAKIWHGPGHQSKSVCERTDPHELDDEHYTFVVDHEWRGEEAYADAQP